MLGNTVSICQGLSSLREGGDEAGQGRGKTKETSHCSCPEKEIKEEKVKTKDKRGDEHLSGDEKGCYSCPYKEYREIWNPGHYRREQTDFTSIKA